jgi:hypothetical protein
MAIPDARAADVVVFPTPPFWFETVIMIAKTVPPKMKKVKMISQSIIFIIHHVDK